MRVPSRALQVPVRHLFYLVNKQLNDKERVAAALENPTLLETLEKCLEAVDSPHAM